jgi:hypothetical protein
MAKMGPRIMFSLDLPLSHKHGDNKAQMTSYEHANIRNAIDMHKYGHRVLT